MPEIEEVLYGLGDGQDLREAARDGLTDPRSLLVVEPLRWALALHPRWIVLEQVPPVLPVWEIVAGILRERGWRTWTGLLSAEQFGVPQTRRRAILLADREQAPRPPPPTHRRFLPLSPELDAPSLFDPGPRMAIVAPGDEQLEPWVSMAEALGWGMTERPIYTVTAGGGATGGPQPITKSGREGMQRELERDAWTVDTGRDCRASCDRSGARSFDPVTRPAPPIDGTGHLLIEEAQAHDWTGARPSTTVACDSRVAAPGHKRNAQSAGSPTRMGDAVRVELDDAAVLQGFPRGYPWRGTRTKQFEQVGNAVPPPLAQAVLAAIVPASARRVTFISMAEAVA